MAVPTQGLKRRGRQAQQARGLDTHQWQEPESVPINTSFNSSSDISFDEDASSSSLWHDGVLFAAILPCLGAFLGAEYIQDLILFLCVTYYLHVIVRVPWSLYVLSQPRPISPASRQQFTPEQVTAEQTLQWRSLSFLGLSLASPFLGLRLLRTLLFTVGAIENEEYVTFFHGTIFVLIAGIRPLRHIVALLAGQTRQLQSAIHHPPSNDSQEIVERRLERLDALFTEFSHRIHSLELAKSEGVARNEQRLLDVQDTFDKTAQRLEEAAKRREKRAEVVIELLERRVEGLEKKCETLARVAEQELNRPRTNGVTASSGGASSFALRWWDRAEEILLSRPNQRHLNPIGHQSQYSIGADPVVHINGGSAGSSSRPGPKPSALLRRRSYEGPSLSLHTVIEEASDQEQSDSADFHTISSNPVHNGKEKHIKRASSTPLLVTETRFISNTPGASGGHTGGGRVQPPSPNTRTAASRVTSLLSRIIETILSTLFSPLRMLRRVLFRLLANITSL